MGSPPGPTFTIVPVTTPTSGWPTSQSHWSASLPRVQLVVGIEERHQLAGGGYHPEVTGIRESAAGLVHRPHVP